jgi:predicted signal transduction protein with EAL and GGDEF domain
VQQDDDTRVLLGRADSALYSAKAAGVNRLFVHNGSHIREDLGLADLVICPAMFV